MELQANIGSPCEVFLKFLNIFLEVSNNDKLIMFKFLYEFPIIANHPHN